MAQDIFSIDGKFYDISIPEGGITRNFSVLDTDKSGRTISGDMNRVIIGTYYNYTIQLNMKNLSPKEYDDFYEKISEPTESHLLSVPYGQEMLTFKAYVTQGQDTMQHKRQGKNKWTGLSLNFVALSPQRRAI